jgi:hypothetical protein
VKTEGILCGQNLRPHEFFRLLTSQFNVSHGTNVNGDGNGACELHEAARIFVALEGNATPQFLEGDGLEAFQMEIEEAIATNGVNPKLVVLAELEFVGDTAIKGEADAVFNLVQWVIPTVDQFAAEPKLLAEQLGNLVNSDINVHVTNLPVVLK